MVTAAIFPGQGSQYVGMFSAYAGVAAVLDAVAEVSEAIGVDLARIMENDEAALNETVNTQPAILAVDVGAHRALVERLPAPPRFLAGHSLGEYAALVCAGALSLAEAARLVARRAELMRDAVSDGGMAAVLGADAATVERVCAESRDIGESVWPANYNSDSQIVIAGLKPSFAPVSAALKAAGAKRFMVLPMSAPSHCPLLCLAADAFMVDLRRAAWRRPDLPILHNAAAAAEEDNGAEDDGFERLRRVMAEQLVRPVRWTDILRKLEDAKVERAYECGPGSALSNLGKKSSIRHFPMNCKAALDDADKPW